MLLVFFVLGKIFRWREVEIWRKPVFTLYYRVYTEVKFNLEQSTKAQMEE